MKIKKYFVCFEYKATKVFIEYGNRLIDNNDLRSHKEMLPERAFSPLREIPRTLR